MRRMNKQIGLAIVSLAAFGVVACTEEHDLPQAAGLSVDRPLAGQASLRVSVPSPEADTRLGYEPGEGYHFEAGDSLAACLMDVAASTDAGASWYEKYRLTDVVTGHVAFVRDAEGVWSAGSDLREGNYFFIYPYKKGLKAGSPCRFTLEGQVQRGTSRESLTRAFAENNLYAGYAPIVADSARQGHGASVELRPVFAALGIRLLNDGRQSYHVRRLTLRLPEGGFPNAVAIDPTDCAYATADGRFNIAQYLGDGSPDGVEAGYDPTFGNYSRREAMRDLMCPLPGAEPAETAILSVEGAEALGRQDSQDFVIMLPEGTYADLLLDVETDEGRIHNLSLQGETVVSTTKGALREVRFTDDDVSALPEVSASSTTDVEYLIRWNVNTATRLTANLDANIRITRRMYEMLRDGESLSLTVNLNGHSVVLDEDVDATALGGKLFFSDTPAGEGRIVVTGEQRLTRGIPAVIRNEGKLVLAEGEEYDIENLGVAEVRGKVKGCVLENSGVLSVGEGAELEGATSNLTKDGLVLNRGRLDGMLLNEGRMANYGESTGNATSINKGEIDNQAGRLTIGVNQGAIHAEGESTTVILADNTQGLLFITGLAENGNILVEARDKRGPVIQELYEDATTDAADIRANTLWIGATLCGAKDREGNAQDIDLSAYTVTAARPSARMENGGKEMKVASLQVLPGATLYVAQASVDCPSVRMEGNEKASAELFISNWGNLYNGAGATVVDGTGEEYNSVRNYGGHDTRIVVNGAAEM